MTYGRYEEAPRRHDDTPRRLYATLTGDGGGIKTCSHVSNMRLEIRASKDGLSKLAATVTIDFPEGAERPTVGLLLDDAEIGEIGDV